MNSGGIFNARKVEVYVFINRKLLARNTLGMIVYRQTTEST
jgi:hypothetical protein